MSITITDTSDPTQKIVITDCASAAAALISGYDPGRFGFFKDDAPATRIYRIRDRMFIGDAAKHTGNRVASNGLGGSKLTENGANWFEKNSQFSVGSAETGGRIGILGYATVLPGESSLTPSGVTAVLVNEGSASYGRALYAEAFHKGSAANSVGVEIQTGNYTGNTPVANAYAMANSEMNALYIGAEGGHGYTTGDADTPIAVADAPCGAAIDISGGSINGANQKFTTGIVFRNGGLLRDGSSHAVAMSLAAGHEIRWASSSSLVRQARLRSDVTASGQDVGLIFLNTEVRMTGAGERAIIIGKDDIAGGGAVNHLQIGNSRTGIAPYVLATGTDTNVGFETRIKGIGPTRFTSHSGSGENLRIVPPASAPTDYLTVTGSAGLGLATIGAGGASTDTDIRLAPKGSGHVRFGVHSAIGAETVTGFIEMRTDDGTLRKLAVVS